MFTIFSWLVLSLTGGFLALWAVWARHVSRWRLVSLLGFLMSILISGGALLLSQGWATSCSFLLPGKYNMIGYYLADPKIYLFLDTQYGPKTCHIPYTTDEAKELQKNGEENGSEFEIGWGFGEEMGEGNGLVDGDIGSHDIRPKQDPHPPKPEEEQPPVFGE